MLQKGPSSTIPWLCRKCHKLMLVIGCSTPRTDDGKAIVKEVGELIVAMVYPTNLSSAQKKLHAAVAAGVREGHTMTSIIHAVQRLRDDVMYEYFGPVWYKAAWEPWFDSEVGNSFLLDASSPTWIPRPWLFNHRTISCPSTIEVPLPLPVLKMYDGLHRQSASANPEVGSAASDHGPSASSATAAVADHLRRLLGEEVAITLAANPTALESLYLQHLRAVSMPATALLLDEQMTLDSIRADEYLQQHLRTIAGWHSMRVYNKFRIAAAEAFVKKALKPVSHVWRARYKRFGRDRLVLEVSSDTPQLTIKIIPDSITNWILGEEAEILL
jgi:hypothetical protein